MISTEMHFASSYTVHKQVYINIVQVKGRKYWSSASNQDLLYYIIMAGESTDEKAHVQQVGKNKLTFRSQSNRKCMNAAMGSSGKF